MPPPGPPARHRTAFRTSHGKATLVFYNRPRPCGGSCAYCILDPGFTKSTIRNEDTLLARDCGWDAGCQIEARFRQYGLRRGCGNKYGLAVKGDSFTNHDPDYLRGYFTALYDFLNGSPSGDFTEARARQRDAPDRCVWVQAETRPDQITAEWCDTLRELGVNTVELGVQCLDDEVLQVNRRGHGVDAVRRATALLRTAGFEVGYHMMAGLPGSSDELDREVLAERLWQPEFAPDCLKIYPCVLLANRRLQPQLARLAGRPGWDPLTDERYRALLSAVLPQVPQTAHINRIQRLIPAADVDLGPRAPIDRRTFDGVSRCLWQRSIGQTGWPAGGVTGHSVTSSPHGTGDCVQATVRDGQVVLGYGRLTAVGGGVAVLRDLRVLGDMVPVGAPGRTGPQHVGIGTAMLAEMYRLARARRCTVLRVHPAVGTAGYFERLGFRPAGRYRLEQRLDVPSGSPGSPGNAATP